MARAVALQENGPLFVDFVGSLGLVIPFFVLAIAGALEWGPSIMAAVTAAAIPMVAKGLIYYHNGNDAAAAAIIAHRASQDI